MLCSIWYKWRAEDLVIWWPLGQVCKAAGKLMKDRSPTTAVISTVLVLPNQMEQNFYKATKKKKAIIEKKEVSYRSNFIFCKNGTQRVNVIFNSIFTANLAMLYQKYKIINGVKVMQLIFIMQLRERCAKK